MHRFSSNSKLKPVPLLVLSPWKNDWDLETVDGSPENAYIFRYLIEHGFELHQLVRHTRHRFAPLPNHKLYPVRQIFLFTRIPKLGSFFQIIDVFINTYFFLKKGVFLHKKYKFKGVYGIGSHQALSTWLLGRKLRIPKVLKLAGITKFALFPEFLRPFLFPDIWLSYKLSFDQLCLVDDGTQAKKIAVQKKIPPDRFKWWSNAYPDEWAELKLNTDRIFRVRNSKKPFIILGVGRLSKLKGFSYLIKAFSIVHREERDTELVIVGDGPGANDLKKLTAKLQIKDAVRFLGPVPHKDLPYWFSKASIFVSSNIYANKTLPVIEAMLFFLSVVAFDLLDTSTLIQSEKTGILVPPFDIQKMAESILRLIHSPVLRKNLGKNAHDFVIQNLPSWRKRGEWECSLWETLIKK